MVRCMAFIRCPLTVASAAASSNDLEKDESVPTEGSGIPCAATGSLHFPWGTGHCWDHTVGFLARVFYGQETQWGFGTTHIPSEDPLWYVCVVIWIIINAFYSTKPSQMPTTP